jgi:hypothetical protein
MSAFGRDVCLKGNGGALQSPAAVAYRAAKKEENRAVLILRRRGIGRLSGTRSPTMKQTQLHGEHPG